MRIARPVGLGIVIGLVLLLVTSAGWLGWNRWQAHRAERAWAIVRDLSPGDILPGGAHPQLPKPWTCAQDELGRACDFRIEAWPVPTRTLQLALLSTAARLKLYGWHAGASVRFDDQGRVLHRELIVGVGSSGVPRDGYTVWLQDGMQPIWRCGVAGLRHPQYDFHSRRNANGALFIVKLGHAPTSIRQQASNPNLNCLRENKRCSLEELSPALWAEYLADKQWAEQNSAALEAFQRSCDPWAEPAISSSRTGVAPSSSSADPVFGSR